MHRSHWLPIIQKIDIGPHPPKKIFFCVCLLACLFLLLFSFSVAGVLPRPEGSDNLPLSSLLL